MHISCTLTHCKGRFILVEFVLVLPFVVFVKFYHKWITLDIKDLFTNVPIKQTINIMKHILRYNHLTVDTVTQYVNLIHIVLSQNCFSYNNKYYTCNKEVSMESSISSTIAEIFLQHYEHLFIKHWIENTSVTYYSRYIDDIFIIFNTRIQQRHHTK